MRIAVMIMKSGYAFNGKGNIAAPFRRGVLPAKGVSGRVMR